MQKRKISQRKSNRIYLLKSFVQTLIIIIFMLAVHILTLEKETQYYRVPPNQVSNIVIKDNIIIKQDQTQDKILACLLYLESTNRHDVVVLDSNNQYSIGGYQFQVETVKDILARFEKRHVSAEQAVKIAKDPFQSKELARRAIFDYQLWPKWYNSFQKMKRGACKEVTKVDLLTIKK
jgi:alpha-tubulin suppressor-like RCC1 family protein